MPNFRHSMLSNQYGHALKRSRKPDFSIGTAYDGQLLSGSAVQTLVKQAGMLGQSELTLSRPVCCSSTPRSHNSSSLIQMFYWTLPQEDQSRYQQHR